MDNSNENSLIILFNGAGVVAAYVMLGISLWLSTDVPLSTKGYWGIGVMMLTISLVNFVKYRFDTRLKDDRLSQLEEAKNERILGEYIGDEK